MNRKVELTLTIDAQRDANTIVEVEVDGVKRSACRDQGDLRTPLSLMVWEELDEVHCELLAMAALVGDMMDSGGHAQEKGLF